MELIDRRKLVSDFWKGVDDAIILSYEDTDDLMENAPTVDAVEVVHGRWLQNGEFAMCSECTELFKEREVTVFRYCPECGAKMDGDGNG